ncbi:MAG TPA: AlpA family phage regulatory protein [Burkholderiaceae bacterium]|nr:AlpA family phage regulatory protein [Burkholderiaceae bacterium]
MTNRTTPPSTAATRTAGNVVPIARPTVRPPLPPADDPHALIDIRGVQTLTCMSESWLHDAIRRGEFCPPLRLGPRCSRWRIADVRAWLIKQFEAASADTSTADLVRARAKKGADAAARHRAAKKHRPDCTDGGGSS